MNCRCTPNSQCRAHRAVAELNAIARDLERGGWKHEADRIGKIACDLLRKLDLRPVPF